MLIKANLLFPNFRKYIRYMRVTIATNVTIEKLIILLEVTRSANDLGEIQAI